MENQDYAIRYKDTNEYRTQVEHEMIRATHGKVLWGAFNAQGSKRLFSENTKQSMNDNGPFYLYAYGGRSLPLLKMRVIKVVSREEVIASHIEHLIPSYYGLEQECFIYYLIDSITTYPPEEAQKIYSRHGTRLYDAHQIPGCTPWTVQKM